jgi:hypothetical protein
MPPTRYKPSYASQAEKLCRLGATDLEMADFFGVTVRTIHTWKHRYPRFLQSLRRGKLESDANVAERLYQRAMGYSHQAVKIVANPNTGAEKTVPYTERYPPDTRAAIFWLKNRRPDEWRDKREQELSAKDNAPLVVRWSDE